MSHFLLGQLYGPNPSANWTKCVLHRQLPSGRILRDAWLAFQVLEVSASSHGESLFRRPPMLHLMILAPWCVSSTPQQLFVSSAQPVEVSVADCKVSTPSNSLVEDLIQNINSACKKLQNIEVKHSDLFTVLYRQARGLFSKQDTTVPKQHDQCSGRFPKGPFIRRIQSS